MKKIMIFSVAILILYSVSDAQLPSPRRHRPSVSNMGLWKLRRYELSVGLGTTQFYGDIGGYSNGDNFLGLKDFSFKQTRFNISPCMRYRITNKFTARLNLAFGQFHSTDARGSNEDRGLESTTFFFEPALIGEFYFIRARGESSYIYQRGRRTVLFPIFKTINVYALGGIGGISFNVNPNDILDSRNMKTKGFAAVIPVGIGANVSFSNRLSFGLELSGRYAFSDYLEGYTSSFSKSNDLYHFFNFTITYYLKTNRNGWPTFN